MYGNSYLFRRLFYICFDLKCYIVPVVMAGIAAAVGVAQLIGGSIAADKARRERLAAAGRMREAAQAKLDYATQLDNDWKDRYGDTTSQVASYYKNLTSEGLKQQYQMTGDKALEQSYNNFQQQMKQLDTKINQMGMQNSSQALSALMQMSTQQMSNNAAINFETNLNKMKADQEVAQQKLAYNQTGQQLQMAAINTRNQGYDMQFNAAQVEAGFAQQDFQSAQGLISSGINSMAAGMSMVGDYYTNKGNQQFVAQQNQLDRDANMARLRMGYNIISNAFNTPVNQAQAALNDSISRLTGANNGGYGIRTGTGFNLGGSGGYVVNGKFIPKQGVNNGLQ